MTVSALHPRDAGITPGIFLDVVSVVSFFPVEHFVLRGFWCRAKHVLVP